MWEMEGPGPRAALGRGAFQKGSLAGVAQGGVLSPRSCAVCLLVRCV